MMGKHAGDTQEQRRCIKAVDAQLNRERCETAAGGNLRAAPVVITTLLISLTL